MCDFKIAKLTDNVIIFEYNGCNVSCFHVGSKCFVVDSGVEYSKTMSIVQYIVSNLNLTIEFLFNTHSHHDHINGNGSFKCDIFSSLKSLENQKKKMESKVVNKYADYIIIKNETQNIRFRYPDKCFEKELKVNFNDITVEMKLVGGHSNCSSILSISDFQICFIGDNAFGNKYPIIFQDSNPIEIVNLMEILIKSEYEFFVPGHGKVLSKIDLDNQIKYWNDLISKAKTFESNSKVKRELMNEIRIKNVPFQENRHQQNVENVIHFLTRTHNSKDKVSYEI